MGFRLSLFSLLAFITGLTAQGAPQAAGKAVTPTSPAATKTQTVTKTATPSTSIAGGGGGGGSKPASPFPAVVLPSQPAAPAPRLRAAPRAPAPPAPRRVTPPRAPVVFGPPVTLTTAVKPMPQTKVMKGKTGIPAVVYLSNFADMRDLDGSIEQTKSQREGMKAALSTYDDLLARQRVLFGKGAVSREEYEQSILDRDNAAASEQFLIAQTEALTARFNQKAFSAKVAAGNHKFSLDELYKLYRQEWAAQCVALKASVAAAEAQLRLNTFVYNVAVRLNKVHAGSHYDVRLRQKDFVAATVELASRKSLDTRCEEHLPTLKELEEMNKGDGNLYEVVDPDGTVVP